MSSPDYAFPAEHLRAAYSRRNIPTFDAVKGRQRLDDVLASGEVDASGLDMYPGLTYFSSVKQATNLTGTIVDRERRQIPGGHGQPMTRAPPIGEIRIDENGIDLTPSLLQYCRINSSGRSNLIRTRCPIYWENPAEMVERHWKVMIREDIAPQSSEYGRTGQVTDLREELRQLRQASRHVPPSSPPHAFSSQFDYVSKIAGADRALAENPSMSFDELYGGCYYLRNSSHRESDVSDLREADPVQSESTSIAPRDVSERQSLASEIKQSPHLSFKSQAKQTHANASARPWNERTAAHVHASSGQRRHGHVPSQQQGFSRDATKGQLFPSEPDYGQQSSDARLPTGSSSTIAWEPRLQFTAQRPMHLSLATSSTTIDSSLSFTAGPIETRQSGQDWLTQDPMVFQQDWKHCVEPAPREDQQILFESNSTRRQAHMPRIRREVPAERDGSDMMSGFRVSAERLLRDR